MQAMENIQCASLSDENISFVCLKQCSRGKHTFLWKNPSAHEIKIANWKSDLNFIYASVNKT